MLVDLHEKIYALFISFVSLLYCICQFVLLYFFVHVLTVCNVYKTLKMPAHWCIYKLIFYITFIKLYLFYISEYKEKLIKLFICLVYSIYYSKKYRIDKQYL